MHVPCANSAVCLMAYGIQWSQIRFAWTYTLNLVNYAIPICCMSFETPKKVGSLIGIGSFRVKPGGKQLAKNRRFTRIDIIRNSEKSWEISCSLWKTPTKFLLVLYSKFEVTSLWNITWLRGDVLPSHAYYTLTMRIILCNFNSFLSWMNRNGFKWKTRRIEISNSSAYGIIVK